MLTFGTSVAINNLLALKAFHTFLFNYGFHDKPNFIEKMMIPHMRTWVERRGMTVMAELACDEGAKTASVSLNDVSAGMFAILYMVQNPHELVNINNGKELFMMLAQMELEFVKVQKPKAAMEYKPNV